MANATAFEQWLSALGQGFSPTLTAAALYDLLAAGGVTATAEALLVEDGPPTGALSCAYQQNRLAIALEANQAWPAAEMFFNAALSNYLARLGPNSRQDATVQSNLARLCHQTGRLAEARDHYRSALMSAYVDPGPETDFTARLLAENAMLLYDLGDKDDAVCALRKALPKTVISVWLGHVRQKSRSRPVKSAPGSALMKSLGIWLPARKAP
jgi:tetratricopeptide (TPR) repeat protein